MDADYKKLYLSLFNRISDLIEAFEIDIEQLKQIQRDAEEMYIGMGASDE